MTAAGALAVGAREAGELIEDRDLLIRVQGGDAGAFDVLVRRHLPRARLLARRLMQDSDDADDLEGVVVPVSSGEPTYPTAGTITRNMEVTVTRDGQAPVTKSRREVVTFDGSSTATVEITENGATRSCSLPLPRGRPTCQ